MSARCAVCGGDDLRLRWRVERSDGASLVATTTHYGSAPADIVRCARCGHMQVAELPRAAELHEAYEEVSEGAYLDEEAGQRTTARRALDEIERHRRGRRGALLDVGCWAGFLLSEAEARGWEAWGIEPSSFATGFARERLGLRVSQGSLDDADLPDGHFDAVVMGDVIEHLPDPGAAVARIRRLLAPGGVFYAALPDAGSAVARLLGRRWWSVIPAHVHYFTRASVARLLADRGFAIEWMDTAAKTASVRYYAGRLEGYSERLARVAVAGADRSGVAPRLIAPDLHDRMALVASRR